MKNNEIIEDLFGIRSGETLYVDNRECQVNLGRIAIKLENLGINDPLSHLFQYLQAGEASIGRIKEDLETDIAERLPETPFVSQVMFDFMKDDFISTIGNISMNTMTKNNLNILGEALKSNPDLIKEYERALIESKEPEKLKNWFLEAQTGAFLIFESLPIGNQEIAVSRIYRKIDNSTLEGSFVSLYQPSVRQFNELRRQIGSGDDCCETEASILDNNYEFYSSTFKKSDDFVEYYKYIYDLILSRHNSGGVYNFGLLDKDGDLGSRNGIDIVKKQTTLTGIYFEALDVLAKSGGVVSDSVIELANQLSLDSQLNKGDVMSMEVARDFLRQTIASIARVIHQADSRVLSDLSQPDINKTASYAAISYYGSSQNTAKHDYANNVCPTYDRDSVKSSDDKEAIMSEYSVLSRSFNLYKKLDNFGTPRIGVCIIKGCPSRGNIEWLPSRTIVGGCSICAACHEILNNGNSPEKMYMKNKSKQSKKPLSRSL